MDASIESLPHAASSPALTQSIALAAERIQLFQQQSTQLFSVSVDILNAARVLDSMGFELQLLARNGVVRAAHLIHNTHGDGRTLLTLAQVLAETPKALTPQIGDVVLQCQAIADHTATCTNLARRYLQHFRGLVAGLGAACPPGRERALVALLGGAELLEENGFRRGFAREISAELPAAQQTNFTLMVDCCAVLLRELRQHFVAVRECLMKVGLVLKAIGRATATVNYLGLNVGIEAAHFAGAGADFQRLGQDIEQTMLRFTEKVQRIREAAETGGALLVRLGA